MRTLAYLGLLQNFARPTRIQAIRMALIGATSVMLAEGSSMAATITVHAPDGEDRVFVDVVGKIDDGDFEDFKEKTGSDPRQPSRETDCHANEPWRPHRFIWSGGGFIAKYSTGAKLATNLMHMLAHSVVRFLGNNFRASHHYTIAELNRRAIGAININCGGVVWTQLHSLLPLTRKRSRAVALVAG